MLAQLAWFKTKQESQPQDWSPHFITLSIILQVIRYIANIETTLFV